jgi:hypothetical protein
MLGMGVAATKRKAVVPNARPYIGNADGAAKRSRAGMDEFIKQCIKHSGGVFWNNGSFMVRDMRGKPGVISVHSTGRAVDLSWRFMPNHKDASNSKGKPKSRQQARRFINILTKNGNVFGLQIAIDYWPKPFGAAWRCDRQRWARYDKQTVSGAPHGDWFHIELNPEMADNPDLVKAAFNQVFAKSTTQP